MSNKSKFETNNTDFRSIIPDYNDEQIISILKKRKLYQKAAAELAIQEAIKRGIISSEQDLFADEYKVTKDPLSLFPIIKTEKNKNRIRESIARILIIIGAVQTIWGVLEIFNGEFVEGFLLFVFGVIWIYSSFKLMKKYQPLFLNLLFIISVVLLAYIVKLLLGMRGLVIMDYLIPLVFYSLLLYGLFLLRRLK